METPASKPVRTKVSIFGVYIPLWIIAICGIAHTSFDVARQKGLPLPVTVKGDVGVETGATGLDVNIASQVKPLEIASPSKPIDVNIAGQDANLGVDIRSSPDIGVVLDGQTRDLNVNLDDQSSDVNVHISGDER